MSPPPGDGAPPCWSLPAVRGICSLLKRSSSIMSVSKSPSRVQNLVLALLALWAVVSIIIIVVWATSPDMKGSAQCRAELRDATEKMEGAKVVFAKDRAALEDLVRGAREDQDRLRGQILLLLGGLNATNHTLEECRQEKVSPEKRSSSENSLPQSPNMVFFLSVGPDNKK